MLRIFSASLSLWDQSVTSCPFSFNKMASAVPQLPAPITPVFAMVFSFFLFDHPAISQSINFILQLVCRRQHVCIRKYMEKVCLKKHTFLLPHRKNFPIQANVPQSLHRRHDVFL
jgi:hypothetical protein